ncbi:hypothetical protein M9H77_35817 [Catharanthus roseus]|uniref:Uncharacterized protein n=1 Tax=Catharanthus roseus TaxID=4058 RepID=A0ACB9ZS90_CATRO|nr:hypothetical protein M9H77_35817 [Catharanthus roseus]
MQGRNTVKEALCLSAERDYTVFYRNREESNVLSDIVVAHPTSIAMIRTWPYVLIIDTTYNMPLLEARGVDRGGCGPIGLRGHRIMLYGGVRPPSGESGGARH